MKHKIFLYFNFNNTFSIVLMSLKRSIPTVTIDWSYEGTTLSVLDVFPGVIYNFVFFEGGPRTFFKLIIQIHFL